jgi:glycosyltransferase involved in cell wall biosynthesis
MRERAGQRTSRASERPGAPLVSVILTTRDRPRFLQIALRSYREQTYPNRELLVVDDGERFPADEEAVAAAGGRVVRVPSGASIGAKLNAGVAQARGELCQKMDDDDWYAAQFLETMVRARLASQSDVCVPTLTFLMPFLFFDLARWEVRRSVSLNIPGATLMFDRLDWQERPFRDLGRDEDVWFYHDQVRSGSQPNPVPDVEIFLAVRHRGVAGARSHTWTHQHGRMTLEEYIESRPLHARQPEDLLPEWAMHAYRAIRADMLPATASRSGMGLTG